LKAPSQEVPSVVTPPPPHPSVSTSPASDPPASRPPDEERARNLSLEWGIAYVDLRQVRLAPDLLRRVPERLLLRHRVLPVSLRNGRLRLAMANPLDVEAIEEMRLVTGYDVEPVVTSESLLLETLQRCMALPAQRGDSPDSQSQETDGGPAAREAYLLGPSTPQEAVAAILDAARAQGASRVFLVPQADGLGVQLRLRGVVRAEPTVPVPLADAVVEHLAELAGLAPGPGAGPRQGRFAVEGSEQPTEARVSSYPTVMGDALVLRLCVRDDTLTRLDSLGMPIDARHQLERLLEAQAGIVLVAGPPGSGRTTTLYALLDHLRARGRAIFTIEEFIERPLFGVAQAEVDEAKGTTALSALRSLLRIEPDVVLIGEIHSPAAVVLAVQLARAGCLVLAGVLGDDAASVVSHLVSAELDPSLFAESLAAVVAQRIVRILCTECREPYAAFAHTLEPVPPAGAAGDKVAIYRAIGCSACDGRGYAAHTGLFELMAPNDKLRALIGARAPAEAVRHTACRTGMTPLSRHALARVLAGDTSVDEVHHLLHDDA